MALRPLQNNSVNTRGTLIAVATTKHIKTEAKRHHIFTFHTFHHAFTFPNILSGPSSGEAYNKHWILVLTKIHILIAVATTEHIRTEAIATTNSHSTPSITPSLSPTSYPALQAVKLTTNIGY
ncbi:hypothetical protein Adt_42157 [Abeliophyllum distichum]|uniref:Uncharacterized protein n=1 Tax=Abeliophyllum distichum TaxID=126358 RepID=A0ABD1PQW2_9LAMI